MSNSTSNDVTALCQTLQQSTARKYNTPFISDLLQIVFVAVTSIFATSVNSVVLVALLKRYVFKTATNLILISMAISDLLVGVLVEPLVAAHRSYDLQKKESCMVKNISSYLGILCIGASFFNICMFAIDRCFATIMPYRYMECNLQAKYLFSLLSSWLSLALLSLLTYLEVIAKNVLFAIMAMLHVFSVLLTLVSYVVIYHAVMVQRKKDKQVLPSNTFKDQPNKPQNLDSGAGKSSSLSLKAAKVSTSHRSTREMDLKISDIAKESITERQRMKRTGAINQLRRSYAVITIFSAYIICYFPLNFFNLMTRFVTFDESTRIVTYGWLNFLVLLNSSLNPVIYCIRVTSIRNEVKKVLQSIISWRPFQ